MIIIFTVCIILFLAIKLRMACITACLNSTAKSTRTMFVQQVNMIDNMNSL